LNKKISEHSVQRIHNFLNRISKFILTDNINFQAEFYSYSGTVDQSTAKIQKLKSIQIGDIWGKNWERAWFKLQCEVPEDFKRIKYAAHIDIGGEGLVFNESGIALQGITNGSIFENDYARDIVQLDERHIENGNITLWIDASANALFGMFQEQDPAEDFESRYGHYTAKLNCAELCRFDDQAWQLWIEMKILSGLVLRLHETSTRRARIIRCANKAIDQFKDNANNISLMREILKTELGKKAAPSDLNVAAVGHAHIDTAWLWPIAETKRKCARTFASQLALIDKYPDYIFGASQPQHYEWVSQLYPEIFTRMKKAVTENRWEVQGGMWVEADCNLISGESMVRQLLYGKNYFKREFGIDVQNLWLPDVFGYSANLPQIMKKSGIKYFLTQKMSWSQYNKFPHHTFLWEGIDGSEILTHFPPEDTYNSQLNTEYLVPGRDNFIEKDFIDEFICLFGVGDGGGGPKEENIEFGQKMADLEGSPRVRFKSAAEFFEGLEQYRDELSRWKGELYLELHRGTYTTQAENKKFNRFFENKLRVIELLYSMQPIESYPQQELEGIWKTILTNQFHDIIPGSSINEAYIDSLREYRNCEQKCKDLLSTFAKEAFQRSDNKTVVFNPHQFRYRAVVDLPEDWHGHRISLDSGKDVETQCIDGKTAAIVEIGAFGFVTIQRNEKVTNPESDHVESDLVLENDLIRYEFDENGNMISAFDVECERELINKENPGNVISLYEDRPLNWDAWDVDAFYRNCRISDLMADKSVELKRGNLFNSLKFGYSFNNSSITQEIRLTKTSKRLDFITEVDWKEKHKMLRVAFPVNIFVDHASFEIQFGIVKRPTHNNTSWEYAQFESVGHRFADLSESDYGCALLNDCKYGYYVKGNILDLNLLRSTTYPDPDADQGEQRFTYSLLPHLGNLAESEVLKEAAILNSPLELFGGFQMDNDLNVFDFEGDGILIESIKKAEEENCLIYRMAERMGRRSTASLHFSEPKTWLECDLLEWETYTTEQTETLIKLAFKPFEIITLMIRKSF